MKQEEQWVEELIKACTQEPAQGQGEEQENIERQNQRVGEDSQARAGKIHHGELMNQVNEVQR